MPQSEEKEARSSAAAVVEPTHVCRFAMNTPRYSLDPHDAANGWSATNAALCIGLGVPFDCLQAPERVEREREHT